MDIVHIDHDGDYSHCETHHVRNSDAIKYYCFECRKYIVPDETHKTEEEAIEILKKNGTWEVFEMIRSAYAG
jgi:hypothetical protein